MRAAFTLAILALVNNSACAVRIQESLVDTPAELSQVDASSAAETASYPPEPIYDDHHRCDHCDDHDDQYYCPPALQKGPGVIQPPSPSKIALCSRPLCYCNTGYMHTDWDHNVSVDDEPCDDCGKHSHKPHHPKKRPHKPVHKPVHRPSPPPPSYPTPYYEDNNHVGTAPPVDEEADLFMDGPMDGPVD